MQAKWLTWKGLLPTSAQLTPAQGPLTGPPLPGGRRGPAAPPQDSTLSAQLLTCFRALTLLPV